MTRRKFLRWSAGAAAAGAVGVTGYTFGIEPHWVEIVRRDLPIRGLPSSLADARLAQISDLHVGPSVAESYLIQCLAKVAQLKPDILVLTGDFVTYRGPEQLTQLRRLLTHLPRVRLGTFGVLGNHDYGRHWSQAEVAEGIAGELTHAGVLVLRNQATVIEGLTVLGMDDLWARRFDAELALTPSQASPALVLCHNPDAVDQPGWGSYQGWVLAGHTHGGQCKPPFLPPPLVPIKNRRYVAGEVLLPEGRQLYINRGLGHLLPVRFNARPEITLFTLRSSRA